MAEELKTYFKLLYDSVRFPIQVFDESGKLIYVNEEFSTQWGYDLSELKSYSVFSDSELRRNGIATVIKEVFEKKEYRSVENYVDSLLLSRDFAVPLLRSSIFPVKKDEEIFVVVIHIDQTEMILAEAEVKKARDANTEAERLKNTFLNVLSHELRTPLNIILGYSTIIKENLKDKITNEDKIYLDNLYSGTERLFKTITQMLEFAQVEAGSYKLNLDTYDMVNIIKQSSANYKKEADEKGLDFKNHFELENIFVEVDLYCLESVINNLLDNAVKFTQKGFIDVEVGVLKDRDLAVCKIKDTGIGISSEYLDHLYRPFSQEDLEVGRHFEGNGLGLALSKRYIEKMGGSLIVDSIKGVGSTFTFTVPLAKDKTVKQFEKTSEQTNGVSKILMLDDSGESFELLKAFLKDDYDIKLFNYKDFNAELLKKSDYKAIVFDVTKNFWDRGLDLCKELKSKDDVNRPLVVLSSEFMKDKIQQFLNAGADEFLVKPFAKRDIVNIIEKVTAT